MVASNLLGLSSLNTPQSGTLTFGPFCTNNAATAAMIIDLQNWAGNETTTFSNVQIICWDDQSTVSATPASVCQGTNFNLNGSLSTPGTIASTMWSGPGTITDPSSLSTTASSTSLGANVYTLTTTDINGCSGTNTTTVNITPGPNINPPADVTVCNSYPLPAITGTNIPAGAAYFTGPNGTGTQFNPGQTVNNSGSLYAFVGIGLCSDEEQFDVTILPAPNITTLPNQTGCGSFTLPNINGNNLTGNQAYYSAPNGGGIQYNPGDAITSSGTYYIYDGVIGCSNQRTFTITITQAPQLDPVLPAFACNQYALPAISGINLPAATSYWTGPNGTGTQYTPGQTINAGTTLFIYANGGAGCTDETTINITIDPAPNVNDIPNVTQCGGYTLPAITGINLTGAQAYYSGTNGTGTSYSEGATITGSGTYYIFDSAGPGCSDQESFTLTLTAGPVIPNPANVNNCGPYTLPAIAGTNIPGNAAYFTNMNGTGTQYTPGQTINTNITLYLYASNGPGCNAQQDVVITISAPPALASPANISGCGTVTLPAIVGTNLTGTQAFYTASNGGGTQLLPGSTVSASGTIYIFDQSGTGCSDEESFTVTITPGPVVTNPADVTNCGAYTLPAITGTNLPATTAYFTQANGAGATLAAGATVSASTTLFLYANAGAGCVSEQNVAITITQPPIITPPANATACGTYTLPALTGTNLSPTAAYYSAPNGAGTPIAPGTGISTSGTYYAFDQSAPGCDDEESFTVTITPGPVVTNPSDVTNCGAYTLPAITGTNLPATTAYYTQANGAGATFAAGATVSASTTLFLYANAGAGCVSEQNVAITITQPPIITPPANATACGTYTLPALTGTNLSPTAAYYSAPNGAGTPIAPGTGISTSGTYYAFDQSAPGCDDEESFTVTITPGPVVTNPSDVTNCGAYTLPAITGTNLPATTAYYTQANGAGATFAAGATVSASTTLFLYANAGAGCVSEQNVAITITQPPIITPPANATACGTYTLPALTGTNLSPTAAYYSAPNGAGTIAPGTGISTSGTYYAFDQSAPGCDDEESFTVTITPGPIVNNPVDVTNCGTYTLPAITGTNLPATAAYFTQANGAGATFAAGATVSASTTLFLYANAGAGCVSEQNVAITITQPPIITPPANATACGTYTLPALTGTNLSPTAAYYSAPNGAGTIAPGTGISTSGTYYAFDQSAPGCDDEESFTVTITPGPIVNNPVDVTNCGTYTLPAITGTNLPATAAYFTQANGAGATFAAGATVSASTTLFLYANAGAGCVSEQNVAITITQPPIITPPANATACGTYTLPALTGTNLSPTAAYYSAPNGAGTPIAPGTGISTSGTYYAFDQSAPGCDDEESFTVTITPGPVVTNPADVTNCGTYTLPAITGTNLPANTAYFTEPNGGGLRFTEGWDVFVSFTLYIYSDAGGGCTSQQDLGITINQPPSITAISDITVCGSATLPAITGTNLSSNVAYFTAPNGSGTKLNVGASVTTSGTYYAFDSTGVGCRDQVSFNVQVTPGPAIAPISAVNACGSYMLPAIVGSNVTADAAYYNGPMGTGAKYTPGTNITASGTYYAYSGTPNGCSSQQVFQVQIVAGFATTYRDTLCGNQTVTIGGQVFNQANPNGVVMLTSSQGCDSTITVNLNFGQNSNTPVTIFTCNPNGATTFSDTLTSVAGCDSILLVSVVFDANAIDTTRLVAVTCNPAQVGSMQVQLTNSFGCDSLVITTTVLGSGDTTRLTATTCNPALAGSSQVNLTNVIGCDSILITTTTLLPADTTLLLASSCNPALVGVSQIKRTNAAGCDSLIITTTTLTLADTTRLSSPTCDQLLIGQTTSQLLTGATGCDSLILTTYVIDPAGCNILVANTQTPVTCPGKSDGTMRFTAAAQTYPLGYRILLNNQVVTSGTIQNATQTGQASMLAAGVYTLQVFAVGDTISTSFTITVLPIPSANLGVSNFNGFAVPCADSNQGSVTLDLSAFPQPVAVTWSDGGLGLMRDSLLAGAYTAFLNYSNGCLDTLEVLLDEPEPLEITHTLDLIPCSGQGGNLNDVLITGGVGPFATMLNQVDLAQNPNPVVVPLTPYLLQTTDANGCMAQDSFRVTSSATLLQAAISKDTTIFVGSLIALKLEVADTSLLQSIEWAPGSCADCFSYEVSPFANTQYSATLVDTNGCPLTLTTEVKVDKYEVWQIPNVLKPSSLDNEFFTVYVPNYVLSIDGWSIYDRWGDLVYRNDVVTTERYVVLWDGKSVRENRAMNPGVYVWVMHYTLIDGTKRESVGDVTVVR
jgi:CHU_C Type IX secretion signal domain